MHARTLTVELCSGRTAAFNFLADVENLPRWAAGFCERLELSRGQWLAWTSEGELFAEIEADERTGVIDLRLGDEHACACVIALRVLTLPGGPTLVSVVMPRGAGQSDFAFECQCEELAASLGRLDASIEQQAAARWTALAS
jgi:hypothetical protein